MNGLALETKPLTFADLPIGALFKFFKGGSTLIKTSERSYSAPQWGQSDMPASPEQTVLKVELSKLDI